MKKLLFLSLLVCFTWSIPTQAQQAASTEQCLSCHGPFDKLVQKDIKFPADPNPVNPHAFIPHDGKEKFYDCVACHTAHPLPPPKGFKDESVNIEPCYSCHHGEQIQNCNKCHKQ